MAGKPRDPARRRITRWVLLSMSLLIAMTWVVNYRAYAVYYGDFLAVGIVSGFLVVGGPSPFPGRGWECGWHVPRSVWWDQMGLRLPYVEVSPQQATRKIIEVGVPFWLLFTLFILPTIWMFRRRRIAGPGCRYCGYDLTGNVSGVCPECGRECDDSAIGC